MARRTKEEAEKTCHALLDAAAELFLQKGTSRTSLQEIAAHAGMTRGAIYWHFSGKDEIVRQIWDRFAEAHHQRFVGNLNALPGQGAAAAFRAALRDILATMVNDHRAGQALSIVLFIVEFSREAGELQHYLLQKQDSLVSAMIGACRRLEAGGALKPGLAPETAAKGILSYVIGLVHQYLGPHAFADLAEEGPELLELYLDAVLVAG